ncbi:ABC transporter I family member 10, chloroplastic [Zostera marina]|uniref:ABC transporter I family member 10, chloroplastic n=1 Tax=Zostera marina TaxID=29655 RepID=A0A0K9NX47_ZOSMR|nr:ABC transporter I family member 10, chloroplastic [Zostera marina]
MGTITQANKADLGVNDSIINLLVGWIFLEFRLFPSTYMQLCKTEKVNHQIKGNRFLRRFHMSHGGAMYTVVTYCPFSSFAQRESLSYPLYFPRRGIRKIIHRHKALIVASTSSTAIEGRNITCSVLTSKRRLVPILKDCSLKVPIGELWMLLGPNGCGKSTLLKVLAGLLNPSSGTVYVNGTKSFVFQNPDHQVVMPTVEADVAFGLGKFNLPLDEVRSRVSSALDAVGMLKYSQRPVQTLSGGQKQRVAIAGALAEACNVLLLDELTTFLDENDQIGVIKAVRDCIIKSGDIAALWVTHRLDELEYADGAICMENGQIVMQGSVSTVLRFIKDEQATYFE